MILQRVSPVTHSVGNCVKRVVVIVSSVLFFRTPVSPINSIGKLTLNTFPTFTAFSPSLFSKLIPVDLTQAPGLPLLGFFCIQE